MTDRQHTSDFQPPLTQETARVWNAALETAAVLVETKTVSRGHPPSNRPHIIKRRYPSLTSMGMAKAIRERKVVT